MVTQVDRTTVYSPELEGLQLGGVTGLSGYTRISKVQYVTGTSQSLYSSGKRGEAGISRRRLYVISMPMARI